MDLDTCWGKYRDSSFVIHMLTSPPPSRDRLDFWRLVEKMWRLSRWGKMKRSGLIEIVSNFLQVCEFLRAWQRSGLVHGSVVQEVVRPELGRYLIWKLVEYTSDPISTCFSMFPLAIPCLMHPSTPLLADPWLHTWLWGLNTGLKQWWQKAEVKVLWAFLLDFQAEFKYLQHIESKT